MSFNAPTIEDRLLTAFSRSATAFGATVETVTAGLVAVADVAALAGAANAAPPGTRRKIALSGTKKPNFAGFILARKSPTSRTVCQCSSEKSARTVVRSGAAVAVFVVVVVVTGGCVLTVGAGTV